MKLCSRCRKVPKLENHVAYCRDCRNAAGREWRLKNPGRKTPTNKEKANAWNSARRARNRDYVLALKVDVGCADCGVVYHPSAMHFHHIDGSEKKFNISQGVHTTMSISRLQSEIDKCELVCANCHAVRTWPDPRASDLSST